MTDKSLKSLFRECNFSQSRGSKSSKFSDASNLTKVGPPTSLKHGRSIFQCMSTALLHRWLLLFFLFFCIFLFVFYFYCHDCCHIYCQKNFQQVYYTAYDGKVIFYLKLDNSFFINFVPLWQDLWCECWRIRFSHKNIDE